MELNFKKYYPQFYTIKMDAIAKKTIIKLFKRAIYAIKNGACDDMTVEEYDILINSIKKVQQLESKCKPKIKKLWIF